MGILGHMRAWMSACARFARKGRALCRNRRATRSALLASVRPDGQMDYVRVDLGGPQESARVSAIDDGTQMTALLRGGRNGGRTLLLLPKSAYLVRRLQLPAVSADEMPALLRLEVESALPESFGPVEVSYRWLTAKADAMPRPCEAYISRRQTVNEHLAGLRRQGIVADIVLPSAVIWAGLLGRWDDVDVLVSGRHDDDSVEVAALSSDGSCLVRAVRVDRRRTGQALDRGFAEFLRSLTHSASRASLRIGCLGIDATAIADEHGAAEGLTERLATAATGTVAPLAHAGASVLPHLEEGGLLETANLMPHDAIAGSRLRSIYRQIAIGVAAVILAMLTSLAALKLATFRYRLANQELASRISHIRSQGEAVGRQMGQLEAIRATRSTSGDLARVIAALAAGTPAEVSYSDVELSETGMVRLRGQAESISLPFLLPEQLEKQPALMHVVLQNVGQRQKGAGATSEFRIDCALERERQER